MDDSRMLTACMRNSDSIIVPVDTVGASDGSRFTAFVTVGYLSAPGLQAKPLASSLLSPPLNLDAGTRPKHDVLKYPMASISLDRGKFGHKKISAPSQGL